MEPAKYLLARQPIVDRKGEMFAYELLFRSDTVNRADVTNDVAASANVISHTFSQIGLDAVLGDKLGFINFSAELLMSDLVDALPCDKIVIEILETVELSDEVIARCTELKKAGFHLALDDVIDLSPAQQRILPLLDVVKFDIMAMTQHEISILVSRLKPYRLKLLAEKIDTVEMRNFCYDLGFDLFQGYYFARPTMLSGKALPPSTMTMLKLISQVANDDPIEILEETLKLAPDLTVNLLKLVNSAAMGLPLQIGSVRSAITVLGRAQLCRWLQIMTFAQQGSVNPSTNPLLQTASARGFMMEHLAFFYATNSAPAADQAFMVGMLSLMEALFDRPFEEFLNALHVTQEVSSALLLRGGWMGQSLKLIEAMERGEFEEVMSLMPTNGKLSLGDLNLIQCEALQWAGQIGR